MEPKSHASIVDRFIHWIKSSFTLKLIGVGVIYLILLVPLDQVKSLIYERTMRSESTRRDVSHQWGREQLISGPVITIPYDHITEFKDSNTNEISHRRSKQYAHFLPESLDIKGNLVTEHKYRGMYEAEVYHGQLQISGTFPRIDFQPLGIEPQHVLWDEAVIQLGLSDLRAIDGSLAIQLDGQSYSFDPGLKNSDYLTSGLHTPIALSSDNYESRPYTMDLKVRGSHWLKFTPLGKETRVHLVSDWPDPSFQGDFLPKQKQIEDSGFEAFWEISHLNRSIPQSWTGTQSIEGTGFGVVFWKPVDQYQLNQRAVKYGALFILLLFMVFFIIQIWKRSSLHIIQYIMLGFSICIFFTLLLAFSEHIGFGVAYLVAASMTWLLLTIYTKSQLGLIWYPSIGIAGMLTFIYFIIQLEDYALLFGALGLFVILAIVMISTRHVQWSLMSKSG